LRRSNRIIPYPHAETARTLGLDVPHGLSAGADEVIEWNGTLLRPLTAACDTNLKSVVAVRHWVYRRSTAPRPLSAANPTNAHIYN